MAVDPKKLEAFVAKDKGGDGGKGGGNPNKKPPKGHDDEHDDEMDDEEDEGGDEEEGDDEKEAEGSLEEEFPTLFQALEDYGDIFEQAADTLETSDLDDDELEEDKLEALDDAIAQLPKPLVKAIKREGSKIDRAKAEQICEALQTGEHIEDAEHCAGFLFHVVQEA